VRAYSHETDLTNTRRWKY